MKKRPLGKLAAYTLLSLGFYQLFWLAETRREMMALMPGIRIPKAIWMVTIGTVNVAAFIIFVFSVLSLGQSGTHASVSSNCWQQYTLSQSATTKTVYTQACRDEIANSEQAGHQQTVDVTLIIAMLAVLAVSTLAFYRWLNHYASAVGQITGGQLSATTTMLYLGMSPLGLGVLPTQDAFNKLNVAGVSRSATETAAAAPDLLREQLGAVQEYNQTIDSRFHGAKVILIGIIVILLIVLVLGVGGIIWSVG